MTSREQWRRSSLPTEKHNLITLDIPPIYGVIQSLLVVIDDQLAPFVFNWTGAKS
jgi:hypothetical protein